MKKKFFKIVALIVGIVVIVFHIVWFYNYSLFEKFTDGLKEIKRFESFSTIESGYIYHVKCPSYTSFTGNLGVVTENNEYALIIWPSRFKDTEYGVMIPSENGNSISVMINKELMAEDKYDQIYIDENRDQIEVLFEKAYEKWGEKYE